MSGKRKLSSQSITGSIDPIYSNYESSESDVDEEGVNDDDDNNNMNNNMSMEQQLTVNTNRRISQSSNAPELSSTMSEMRPDQLQSISTSIQDSNGSMSAKKKRKTRIPWDRRKDGDKNGLKRAMFHAIIRRKVFRSDRLEENFAWICEELSMEGNLFAPYGGITSDAAQKKTSSILKDIQEVLGIDDYSDLNTIEVEKEESISALALEVMKQKRDSRDLKHSRMSLDSSSMINQLDHLSTPNEKFHSNNRSDTSHHHNNNLNRSGANNGNDDGDDDDNDNQSYFTVNIRPQQRRKYVSTQLSERNIQTIGDLLRAVPLNQSSIDSFIERTKFHILRPSHYLLGLFEEIMASKNCYHRAERDLGLSFGDATDLIEYLRPYYLIYDEERK